MIQHAAFKGEFEGKIKQAGIFVTRTHTKQHEAPTTNTKAIMVIKEADLFVL